jgi:hypothetical protein
MKLIHLSPTKISSPSKAVERQNIKTDSIFAQKIVTFSETLEFGLDRNKRAAEAQRFS